MHPNNNSTLSKSITSRCKNGENERRLEEDEAEAAQLKARMVDPIAQTKDEENSCRALVPN